MRVIKGYVLFWKSFLGNWSRTPNGIEYDGHKFPTSEHVFMYIKAKLFGDLETAEKILNTDNPKEAKDLGRQVKGFNEQTWDARREGAMYDALMARARDDEKFRKAIVKYVAADPLIKFVEASPFDTIWGIGMSEDDPDIKDEKKWKGKNLLGKTMTRVANWWYEESKLNTWKDSLIWCPSQCYYTFREKKTGTLKCLYLRWRHSDPWTAELIPVNEIDREFESSKEWVSLNPPYFTDIELDKLKVWCMEKLKELELI